MRNLLYILFVAVLISSCEKTEKVDDFPVHKSQLVTNCFFNEDTCFVFFLSKSLSPLDNAPFKNMNSSNAFIRVFENGILFDSFRYDAFNKNYHGDENKRPKEGALYKFECSYPGYPLVFAEDYIPSEALVNKHSIYTTITQTWENTDTVIYGAYNVNLNVDLDPVKTGNCLIFSFAYVDSFYKQNYHYTVNLKDLNPENEYVTVGDRLFIYNENGIKSLSIKWESPWGMLYKNKITIIKDVLLQTCTKNTFEYLKRTALQAENADDPFSEPTPISNSIQNGFGVFGGINEMKFRIRY